MGGGRWRNKEDNHLNIKTVKEMDIFGITFGRELKNWEKVVASMKRNLNFYLKRKLSYIGKAKLIIVFILPKVWYLATIFPPPQDIIKDIEGAIFEFLWYKRKDKINRKTMYLPVSQGGVGLMDINLKYLSLFLNQMM